MKQRWHQLHRKPSIPGLSKGGQVPHWQPTADMKERVGMQKEKASNLLLGKNWGERGVCWVQHRVSITFTPMGWPWENGNSSALLGLEILMFHFSLWVQLICLKSIVLLFIIYVVLSTAEMNCFLNLCKYIQTGYNGGTWLTDSYDNDFPPVTFITITEGQYFTAEPVFTTLLSWAELTHACGPAERNKSHCFWVPCKIKAASVKFLGLDQLRCWTILSPAELDGAFGISFDLSPYNGSVSSWPWWSLLPFSTARQPSLQPLSVAVGEAAYNGSRCSLGFGIFTG